MHAMRATRWILAFLGAAVLAGSLSACAVTAVQPAQRLPVQARWALLPMVNYAEAPQAGERAEAILGTLVRRRGIRDLTHYPASVDGSGLPVMNDQLRLEKAEQWAKGQGFQYGITGAVSEWQYKTGLDGEPAVGLTVKVVDLHSGQVIWSASGADSGWGYDSLSGTAQKLLEKLVSRLPLKK